MIKSPIVSDPLVRIGRSHSAGFLAPLSLVWFPSQFMGVSMHFLPNRVNCFVSLPLTLFPAWIHPRIFSFIQSSTQLGPKLASQEGRPLEYAPAI